LGTGKQVTAGEDFRDCLHLNGRWTSVALRMHSTQEISA
jgi:hypothetical protein